MTFLSFDQGRGVTLKVYFLGCLSSGGAELSKLGRQVQGRRQVFLVGGRIVGSVANHGQPALKVP